MILRGAIRADFSWKDGKVTALTLTPKEDCAVQVRVNGIRTELSLSAGQETKVQVV